jgi:hypothetical protein
VIVDNLADKFGGGIEVYADVEPTIDTNLIKGNVALGGGGGIDVFANSLPTIVNNTIVRNCVQDTVATCLSGGGGLTITNSAATIVNNVIAWNESGGGFAGVDVVNSAVTLESNDTFANQPRNYSGVADPTGTLGNISTDPGFLDDNPTMFGHQPASDSPLVDGGATVGLATDLKGIPRPLDGDVDGTALADIGARENEGISRLRFDTPTSLLWDGGVGPTTFNLYRGDLQILIDTGIYTQDPLAVAGARQFCDLVAPMTVDSDEPDSNQVFFYLAVLESGGIEGTLGFDSVPVERPFTDPNRCP